MKLQYRRPKKPSHRMISQECSLLGCYRCKIPLHCNTWFLFPLHGIHFCRRGREGLTKLRRNSFIFKIDDNGDEYATMSHLESTKNHKGDLANDPDNGRETRMYATGTYICPVSALKLYLEKLNPKQDAFYQRPRALKLWKKADSTWYEDAPVGKNTLGSMMTVISEKAKLSQRYTNHCLRATCITTLMHAGYSRSDVKSISGHRCDASLDSYFRPSRQQKRNFSDTLQSAMNITPECPPVSQSTNQATSIAPKTRRPSTFIPYRPSVSAQAQVPLRSTMRPMARPSVFIPYRPPVSVSQPRNPRLAPSTVSRPPDSPAPARPRPSVFIPYRPPQAPNQAVSVSQPRNPASAPSTVSRPPDSPARPRPSIFNPYRPPQPENQNTQRHGGSVPLQARPTPTPSPRRRHARPLMVSETESDSNVMMSVSLPQNQMTTQGIAARLFQECTFSGSVVINIHHNYHH